MILAALLVALVAMRSATVAAEAAVIPPSGWWVSSGAAPEAQRRADEWKRQLNLPITQVMSSPFDDRFRETIAVFQLPDPVRAEDFADETAAQALLQTTVTGIVGGATPNEHGLRQTGTGEAVAWARWTIDKISYDCVLAPSGEDSTLIVMAVRTSALEDHRNILDRVVRDLDGVTAAMPSFSLLAWRGGSIALWLILGLLLHGLMLRFVDTEGDHNQAGRRAATVNFVCVLVGSIAAYVTLGDLELALVHAGTSVGGTTAWVMASGICIAGLHFMVAAQLDRGVVRSAPTSGVYSGTYSASGIHASLSQSSMRLAELSQSSVGDLSESSVPTPKPSSSAASESSAALARPAPVHRDPSE